MRILLLLFAALLPAADAAALELTTLSTVKLGRFDEGAAEMIDYDPVSGKLFASNGMNRTVAVIDLTDPTAAKLVSELDISAYGKAPTCVAVKDGIVAVTIVAHNKQEPGRIAFFSTAGEFLEVHPTGPLPDNVTFSPDGKYCVVANEGEPSPDYKVDPEGSLTVIQFRNGLPESTHHIRFTDVEPEPGVRIFGPGASVAQDLEPEYVAISGDSKTAFVVCQENNAIAIVDLEEKTVTAIKALGVKDHRLPGAGFDASDESGQVEIVPRPVFGLYQPDAILSFDIDGKGYLITANEGDARDYDGFSEEVRVRDLTLDPDAFPDAAELQSKNNLGRLKTTTTLGDTDGDGDHDEIYSFGARSFSIWDESIQLVFDSGDDFERRTFTKLGEGFNANNDAQPSFKDRSDDRGPEPEALAVGVIDGRTYAFIGLERVGGILVYEITTPAAPEFVTYFTNRNFDAAIDSAAAGDLGPEDLEFIPAADSPNGTNLLISANEVSGTVTVMQVK